MNQQLRLSDSLSLSLPVFSPLLLPPSSVMSQTQVDDTERDADAGVPSVQQVVLLCLYVLFSQGLGFRVHYKSLYVLTCPGGGGREDTGLSLDTHTAEQIESLLIGKEESEEEEEINGTMLGPVLKPVSCGGALRCGHA